MYHMASNTSPSPREREADTKDIVHLAGLAMALGYSLGNPLTAVAAQVRSLTRNLTGDRQDLAKALLAAKRIEAIIDATSARVSTITQTFHGPHTSPAVCDLNDIMRAVAQDDAHQTYCSRLQVNLDLSPDLPLLAIDRAEIAWIVAELMRNAAEAMSAHAHSDGQMTVRTRGNGEAICVEIDDSGGGTPDPERIFDLSCTTKQGRAGLGLSIARALALSNGGQLRASGNTLGGLTATLFLPMPTPANRLPYSSA